MNDITMLISQVPNEVFDLINMNRDTKSQFAFAATSKTCYDKAGGVTPLPKVWILNDLAKLHFKLGYEVGKNSMQDWCLMTGALVGGIAGYYMPALLSHDLDSERSRICHNEAHACIPVGSILFTTFGVPFGGIFGAYVGDSTILRNIAGIAVGTFWYSRCKITTSPTICNLFRGNINTLRDQFLIGGNLDWARERSPKAEANVGGLTYSL